MLSDFFTFLSSLPYPFAASNAFYWFLLAALVAPLGRFLPGHLSFCLSFSLVLGGFVLVVIGPVFAAMAWWAVAGFSAFAFLGALIELEWPLIERTWRRPHKG